jgi:hypothetical protein
MLLHGGRAFADAGIAVAAEIGKDEAIASGECLGDWEPEFMMDGERMQEDDVGAGAEDPVDDFGGVAFDALRGIKFHAEIKSQVWLEGGGELCSRTAEGGCPHMNSRTRLRADECVRG